ncbi:hypothetical protein DID76_01185 [Candidatus Marinamargulisbacteria bacterium SCGC AG-414-C22]|nr:hypothetical protein DID76_01185 [Candidatus Marinamargulisbacteria bacterium SCGC AG-414-C22]
MNKNIIFAGAFLLAALQVFVLFEFFQLKTSIKTLSTKQFSVLKDIDKIKNKVGIENYKKVYNIPIGNSVVIGNKNAKVTIIKWTDFQCPYCQQSVKIVKDILRKYPKDVKVVIKNYPLRNHPQALIAAKYALAAREQGHYENMYYEIYKRYRDLKENEYLPLEIAQSLGLDINKLKEDAKSANISNLIKEEMKQLNQSGLRLAVPRFLINGKIPEGPRSIANWSRIIDAELNQ